jgi:arylsulfatase A-like enzyme
VPRAEDLGPAVITALVGLLPLLVARGWVARLTAPNATFKDLWRVQFGEIEAWCIVAFVGAVVLRHSPRLLRPVVRVAFHLFGTLLLLASIVELVFFAITGGRADIELLAFTWNSLSQVAPVFLSEVHPWHVAVLAVGCALGLAPMFTRFSRPFGPMLGRCSLLLLVPVVWMEDGGHRARPAKALRLLQPSLIEQLWWDGLERVGDTTTPPTATELAPITLHHTEEKKPFNIVLVLLESTGAQDTSVYQHDLATTPNLLSLANKGWWVRTATAVVPHTSKAIVSTLCGTWPELVSEIRESRPGGLPQRCLPQLLEELGYRTAWFQTAHEQFENRGSLVHNLGYDLFRSRDTLRGPGFERVNYFGIEDRAMLEPGLAWSKSSDQPFFATYLTLTSHHDYGTPSHWPKVKFPNVKSRQEQYFNAVRYVDDFVGKLVHAYEAAGLADNTLFWIQGDHGEAFDEHGRSMHDLVIYEEGLRIPMVLYGPGVLPGTGVIEGPRQQVDVLPTVLGMLGVKAEGGYLPGTSLWDEVPASRTLFHSCWRSHRCLAQRVGDKKLVDNYRDGPMQYFTLQSDPRERHDRLLELPADAAETARAEMRAWRARVNGRYDAVNAEALADAQRPDDSPAIATWAGTMDLLGCEIEEKSVLPAEAVWVRCRWRAKSEISQAWRIDARLEGGFDPVSSDLPPFDGLLPTFKWKPGIAVEDEVRVFVPADAKPGPAKISLGWERYGNGAIGLDGGGERFEVGSVDVLAPLHPYLAGADGDLDDAPSEDPAAQGPAEDGAAAGP